MIKFTNSNLVTCGELSDLSIPVTVGKAVYQVKFLAVTKQDKLTFAAREIVA